MASPIVVNQVVLDLEDDGTYTVTIHGNVVDTGEAKEFAFGPFTTLPDAWTKMTPILLSGADVISDTNRPWEERNVN